MSADLEEISIVLAPDLVSDLRAAIAAGDYGSVNEVVRDALRDWQMRRRVETLETDELRRRLQQGLDSGPAREADAVFARLRARFCGPPQSASAFFP